MIHGTSAFSTISEISALHRCNDLTLQRFNFAEANFPDPQIGLDIFTTIHNHLVVDRLGLTFAALSDPTRRLIVDRLTNGPATVNQLAAPFSISQQAVSKHLAYLASAHLIERRWQGRQNFCALKPEAIREVAQWAEGYRRIWERNFQRLDALLAEMKSRQLSSTTAKSAVRKNTYEKK